MARLIVWRVLVFGCAAVGKALVMWSSNSEILGRRGYCSCRDHPWRASSIASDEVQVASFANALWGINEFPRVEPSANVTCTVYEIGGSLTGVLSKTCNKQLPLIPHVGVRIYGREYFYSDRIESRPSEVMAQMLGSFPQISFDLGPPTMNAADLEQWLKSHEVVSLLAEQRIAQRTIIAGAGLAT